jgi:ADP-heptose:LPS heptosyltransferase
MKILVISLAGIGDTLIATPLLHELRLNYPGAVLDVLALWPGARDLLVHNPWINTVYQRNLLAENPLAAVRYFLSFRKQRYDISVNSHPQSKLHYRVAAWLIGAKTRLSHAYDNSGCVDRWFVPQLLPQDYSIHSIENNLRLLSLLGKSPRLKEHEFEVFLSAEERAEAQSLAETHGLAGQKVVGMHVGSGTTKNLAFKRWPLELRLIQQKRPDLRVLLFGGPEERKENEHLVRETDSGRIIQPATKSIRAAAALLPFCHTFVSVDNALMHLAAAMKVPRQIVIESPAFGPTLAPYRRPFRLVENPAVHGRNLDYYRYDGKGIRGTKEELRRCMEAVQPEAVFAALCESL